MEGKPSKSICGGANRGYARPMDRSVHGRRMRRTRYAFLGFVALICVLPSSAGAITVNVNTVADDFANNTVLLAARGNHRDEHGCRVPGMPGGHRRRHHRAAAGDL